jgi:catechol 2,3-dioxygenase-like lactoylglutathione lyase family enzyme
LITGDAAPRLFRVILHVGDLDAAVRFYTQLLGAVGRTVAPGRYYLDCGGMILALLDVAREEGGQPRAGADHVYFAVIDVDAVFARARGLGCLSREMVHGAPAGEVVVRPWGERSFYCVDPWGNPLCFVDERTVFTGRCAVQPSPKNEAIRAG